MSSEELRAIAHDDPKYLEASRNELAMRQIAADARIRDLERQLDTSNAKNACKDVEIKALNDKLEASTKKATRLKSKYQNSQLACGDIFESLKKILTNYADRDNGDSLRGRQQIIGRANFNFLMLSTTIMSRTKCTTLLLT